MGSKIRKIASIEKGLEDVLKALNEKEIKDAIESKISQVIELIKRQFNTIAIKTIDVKILFCKLFIFCQNFFLFF